MSIKGSCVLSSNLCFTVLVSGLILSSSYSFATDSIEDDVSISVPIACSLTSTLDSDHTSIIYNGTNTENIGTTTMQVFCNDAEGFAIYAAGYTGNEIGGENSTKLIGMNNQTPVGNISTGIATSGNTSNWSMKVTKVNNTEGLDPVAYNPNNLTIESDTEGSFSNYHTVPSEYTKVATFSSSTDVTLGSLLKTTYQAYISPTQPAGTYNGQVKYVLIHPSAGDPPVHDDQIGVIYHGNGLTFPSGANKNRVVYEKSCIEEGYVGNTPTILKTSNLNNDGTQNGAYASDYQGDNNRANEEIEEVIPFDGAIGIKVVVDYAITANSADLYIYEGEWGDEVDYVSTYDETNDEYINMADTKTYIVDGDTVSIYAWLSSWKEDDTIIVPEESYDYGFFIRLYPIYAVEQNGTSLETLSNQICSFNIVSGAYNETTTWNDYWFFKLENEVVQLRNNSEIQSFIKLLSNNDDSIFGSTIDVYAYNPYIIEYNGNGATAGTMDGFYNYIIDNSDGISTNLLAPNFKKDNYGFAGWSERSSATVNSNDIIFGPNETITGNMLSFDKNTREATLYAVWVPTSGSMQNWAGCDSLALNQVIALTDNRDDNVYTVGRQADGICWMMENLRLDNISAIDSNNTNNPSNNFSFPSASSDEWCNAYNDNLCNNQNKVNTNNTNINGINSLGQTLITTPDIYINGGDVADGNKYQWYSYGNYYSWYTATAGTGSNIAYNGDASGDICPSGWSLPIGYISPNSGLNAQDGHFYNLDIALGGNGRWQETLEASNRWRSFPRNFVLGGRWRETGAIYRGYEGNYTSRTSTSSSDISGFIIMFKDIRPDVNSARRLKADGYSIRCISTSK